MSNVVKIIGVSFITLAILGVPVLLFLSFMLDYPFFIKGLFIIVTVLEVILVWAVVEMLYEDDNDR